jgi:DNA repair exonuclease SbcCD ATPase subunit
VILRSIRVSGWRCFADEISVGPFQEGLNVIYAPNASGKSTLFEAMRRGLLDVHRVGGKEVEVIRPWGRHLAPTVAVEFSHGGREYRIAKRFLDNPSSKLERKEGSRFVSLAEAGKADEMVRGILSKSPPGRGLSRRDNSGLAQVLWVPQGRLALEALSGDLLVDIRTALGGQVAGPTTSPTERKVEEAYLRVFTPTGKHRSGKEASALVQLEEKLEAARAERTTAVARQREYEDASRRVEDLRAMGRQARRDAEAMAKELREARIRAESFQKLTLERNERAARAGEEEAKYADLKRRIDDIDSARREIKKATESLQKMEGDLPLHERELRQRQKEAAGAKSALENVRNERPKVDAARELAEQARQFVENAKALAALDTEIRKITAALEALDRRKKEWAELAAPDDKAMKAIRKAAKKRDEAQLLIEASLITLEVVPEKSGKLIIVTGEKPGELKLSPGVPARVTGSPEVVADLPGVSRLRASGPTGSVEEHRAARAEAERELQRLTKPFGTSELESLEVQLEKSRALDKKVGDAENQIETWLAGRTLDEMQRQRSEIQTIRARMIQDHPEWRREAPDPSALRSAADEASRSFVGKVEKAESGWETAQNALTAARGRSEQASRHAEAARTLIKSSESKLADLTNDGKSDEQRAEELKRITLSWDAAKAKLEEIAARLLEFKDSPVATVATLEKQVQAAEEAARQAGDDEKTEEGKLQMLTGQGTYSALVGAEERVASLQAEVVVEELRARAIRLLYDTLKRCRAEAVAAVAGPVEAVATQMFQRIAGGRLGRLELGGSFEPAGVVPEISGEKVPLASVSGGEQEQIHLATRLALAEVLAREERQMVVLDDVMTFTDAGRMARVMAILEEEAQRLQIMILTCHPERYRGLNGALFIDLQDLLAGGGAGSSQSHSG